MGESSRAKSPNLPLGVLLIGLYSAIVGVVSLIVGIVAGLISNNSDDATVALALTSFLTVALGVAYAAAAYGLFSRQAWGRGFAWWLYLVAIPLSLAFLLADDASWAHTVFQLLGTATDALIVWYLRRDAVKRQRAFRALRAPA